MKVEKRHLMKAVNYGKYIFGLIVVWYTVGLYKSNEFVRIPLKNDQMEPKLSASSSGGSADDLAYTVINPLSDATNNPQVDQIVRYEWTRVDVRERDVQEVLYLGRVIALPGQRVRITAGDVYIDGTKISQDYVANKSVKDNYEEIIIPKGHVYILVDNRTAAEKRPGHYLRDSRQLGPIPIYLINGVAKD